MTLPKRTLIVDDNALDAELTLRALRAREPACDAVVVQDGVEALDYLHGRGRFRSQGPGAAAMILLDLKMPGLDGFEVLRQIKGDARCQSLPVVIFSSSRVPEDLARAYQLGANGYVVKPVNFQQFSAAIGTIAAYWLHLNEAPPAATGSGRPKELMPLSALPSAVA